MKAVLTILKFIEGGNKMTRKKINLAEMLVIIKDSDKKIFSVHQGCMERSIINDVNQLQEQGRNIICFTIPVSSGKINESFKQVDDARLS